MDNGTTICSASAESNDSSLEADPWAAENASVLFTIYLLPQLVPFRYVDIVLSIAVVIESALCALAILLNKALMRNNIAILVAFLYVAYVVLNFGILVNQSLSLIFLKQDDLLTAGSLCFLKWVLQACGGAFVIDMSFLIAFDRCAASVLDLSLPSGRKRCWIAAQMSLILIHLISIIFRLGADWLRDDFALCSVVQLIEWESSVFIFLECNTLITATFIMYLFGIIWARRNVRRHTIAYISTTAATRKAQLTQKTLITLAFSFFLTSIYFLATSATAIVSSSVYDKRGFVAMLKLLCLNSFGSFLSVNLLLLRLKQIRHAIVRLIIRRRPVVRDSLASVGANVNDQMSSSQL